MIGCPFRKLHRTCIHIMQPRLGQSGIIEIGQVAARAIWHHRAMLESQAGAPPHSPEAVHSRLRVAQVVSDCCVRRFVYPKRLLLGECAQGPPAGSVHLLPSLIQSFRSSSAPYYPHRPATAGSIETKVMKPPEVPGLRYTTVVKEMFNCDLDISAGLSFLSMRFHRLPQPLRCQARRSRWRPSFVPTKKMRRDVE